MMEKPAAIVMGNGTGVSAAFERVLAENGFRMFGHHGGTEVVLGAGNLKPAGRESSR
jgi:hypothetical protein